jgi:Sodium/hydrogen exchanger family
MTKQLYGQSCIGHPNVTRTTTNYQSPSSRRRNKMNYRRPYVCAKVMLFAVWGILFLMATRTATRTIYLSKPMLSFYVLAFTVKTRTYSPNRRYIPSHLRYTSSGLYRSQRCSIPNGPNNRHPCTDAMVLPERPTHMIPTATMMYSLPMDLLEHMHSLPVLALPSVSHVMHTTSSFLAITKADIGSFLPFSELGRELSQSLDIGSNLSRNVGNLPETTTGLVLESLGYDLLVFLAASVFVTPICRSINTTPILGYLIIGALLGPHGLDVFANSKADVELGDFGILFLLFSEGLEVTTPRLRKLANFLPLGYVIPNGKKTPCYRTVR